MQIEYPSVLFGNDSAIMLTIATINPKQAEEYYQQENYYSKNAALENSEWWGRGAKTLGLEGAIADNEVYKNLVNGLSPAGKQALRGKPKRFSQEQTQAKSPSKQIKNKKQKKQSSERAGVDLTFSAPKSVSLACLVGGDKRLEEAHRQAVKRTLEFIEKHYPQTRVKKQRLQTDNLTVAMWHHDTSRELDPHLHSHCVVMNFTQLPNGRWQSRTDENLYYNKMLLGQIYRNELALECRKLGYEIELQPKELFEIKGYTREQIEAFSKRHEQIVKYLEAREIDVTTESKVWAWRRTRINKNYEIDRQEMLPYWHQEADLYEIVHPVPVQELQTGTATEPQVKQEVEVEAELQNAVSVGIEHCSERKVAFKTEEILKFVTAEVKPFGINDLERAIAQHPELIKTFDGRYTTQASLARELATIELMQQGKGQVHRIAEKKSVERYLEGKKLTSGQREAIALTASTADRFIAWQGVAGAGKTYALNQFKQVITALSNVAPDYVIKGFAPSASAAKVLEEELGVEANTVARLLASKTSEQIEPNQIWIVDEAGLLSAKAARELLETATEERARVILVGDTRQLSAIEAGNPFRSLQQAGIQTARLDESLRQKAPDLQKAVNLAGVGQIAQAIAHLEQVGRIEEIPDAVERTNKIAAEYVKLSKEKRENTLILAGTHKDRSSIVNKIRESLKQEGTLGYEVEATKLKAVDLTSVQARYTHNYSVGDVVVPIRKYRRSGLHKSQSYTVKAITQDKLIFSDLAGNQLVVDPMKFRKAVYKAETIEIAVGDRLRWTRNDKELGRRNGQEFTVIGIEGQIANIQYLDGKSDRIDLTQPLHCDYALVSTTYSSQGKTADRVLISSTIDGTVSQESVYVAISRAKHDLQIFAEDRSFLFEQAEKSNAQETVVELLQPQPLALVAQASPARVSQEAKLSVGVTEPSIKRKAKSSPNIEQPIKHSRIPIQVELIEPPRLKQKIERSQPIECPKRLEAFWVLDNVREAPPHIDKKHWRELVEGSAIHPAIASRNFRSLGEDPIEKHHEAWEYLMYSDKLERTNTGRLAGGMLNRYAHIEEGGWWCSAGVDARSFTDLQPGEKPSEQIWGCYKPNAPRENPEKPGKKIKYEHPPKTDLGIFLLDVPDDIAERIYSKAGVTPQESDRANGFWYCVWKHNLPVTITEGAKKAACLLSQGHAAIGLPGIYAGYRSKDEQGNQIKARLHEELAVFATPGREVRFCFDFETREETKRNIEIAISRTGSLLQQQGVKVKVVSLPGPEKGIDDFIVANSPLAYERQNQAALRLQEWRSLSKQRQTVEPPKKLSIEQRKELQSFQPPVRDETKWQEVRQYLVGQQGLPALLIDDLHSFGKIYAASSKPESLEELRSQGYSQPENITKAVFLRQDLEQKTTGASLHKVSNNNVFKGLAPDSYRDNGWFSFTRGAGQLERIVLTESAIDALSAAALAKQLGKTMFMSTDGAGSVPVDWLQQQQAQGIEIIAALSADRAGEEIAWRLAAEVGAISRAAPTHRKDWSEQLKSDRQPNKIEILLDPSEWQHVAQAIGKPVAYINRIKAVTEAGKVLPEQAVLAMQRDFNTYRQTSNDLWQWHKVAEILNESEAYLKQIANVAIAFHHPKQPVPLLSKAKTVMQQEQQKFTYRLRYQELQERVHQSPKLKTSSTKDMDVWVAILALKESANCNEVGRIIAQSDQVKIWKQTMSEQEVKSKAKDYIREVCSQAHNLQQDLMKQGEITNQKRKRVGGLEL